MRLLAWRIAWVMVLAAGLPGAAPAQSLTPATPQACFAVENDAERLMCYDNALGRIPADAPVADNIASPDIPALETGKGGLLDSRWELARDSKLGVFHVRGYKPIYLSPVSWTSNRNTFPQSPNPVNTVADPQSLDSVEAKFQLSFKFKLAENLFGDNGDLWGAYTQSSRWQVYDGDNSRPFRETNYEPEVMLVMRTGYRVLGWRGRMVGVGLNHQSNGRGEPLSRSWNRVVMLVGLDRGKWALMVRPWQRLNEGAGDDNPDIADYLGRGDVTLVHTRQRHQYSLMARHSLRSGDRFHGALQFEWAFPIRGSLRGRVEVFHGYGESMIDYNHEATWVSLGFSLVEWY